MATLGCIPDNQVLCHMPLLNYSLTRHTGRNLRRGNLVLAAYFYLVAVSRVEWRACLTWVPASPYSWYQLEVAAM